MVRSPLLSLFLYRATRRRAFLARTFLVQAFLSQ